MKQLRVMDLGRMEYVPAWDLQTQLHQQLVARKLAIRDGKAVAADFTDTHYLLFVEHPHVYTLGKSGSLDNLLLDEAGLAEHQATYHKINRGGDITYHGPGQLVVYAILDLDEVFTDVHRYVRTLEEAVIRTIADFGVTGRREPDFTGVWLDATHNKAERKICALGVHLSRWVTMHGLGFNINTDLQYFEHIVPCGISPLEKSVTSLAEEVGHPIDINEVKQRFTHYFCTLFELEPVYD